MIKTAIWKPPSLCGCQIKMTAEFTEGSIIDGISYRHPKPFTITAIDIVNVCSAHQPNTRSLPDTSNLMEKDQYTGLSYQARGYLKFSDISIPTPAQSLYAFLSQYGGQTHSYPCGCKAHQFVDENKNITYLDHPQHTKKCLKHSSDTIDMKQATDEFNMAQPIMPIDE